MTGGSKLSSALSMCCRLSLFGARQRVAEFALPVALAILSTPFGLLRGPNTISGTKINSQSGFFQNAPFWFGF